jgi:L-asparaginase II
MQATNGRILGKEGAEGVFCAADPEVGWGLAAKVGDGSGRAAPPTVLAMLEALDLIREEESKSLADMRETLVVNRRGKTVGDIRAEVSPRVVAAAAQL